MANLPDPSTLTDEELDKILAGEQPEDVQDENLEDEDQDEADTDVDNQEDEQDDDSEEEAEADKKDKAKDPPEKKSDKPDDDEEEEKPTSRREQYRVRQLLEKYGPPKAVDKPAVTDALDYKEALDTDDETLNKLQQDRDKVTDQAFKQGLEQAKSIEFRTFLEIDAPRVEAKYPKLDKSSSEFNEDAAADVNLLYLMLTGWDEKTQTVKNPNFRYLPFVDTIFTLAKDLASEEAREITKNVKKQAAKTGLRPDGSRTKKLNLNKAPEDMTDEELDAYLKQAIPS